MNSKRGFHAFLGPFALLFACAAALGDGAPAAKTEPATKDQQQGATQAKQPEPPPPPPFSQPKLSYKEAALATFESNDKFAPPKREGVAFIGSSLFQNWPNLARDMDPMPVINRGVGGTGTDKLIELYTLGVAQFKPKAIVVYCGDEDLSKPDADPKKAFQNVKDFVERVKSERPTLKIAFLSVKASPKHEACLEVQKKFNAMLKDFCGYNDNLSYIDIGSVALSPDGKIKTELFKKDGFHLNNQGYDFLAKELKPAISKLWTEASSKRL